MSRNAVAFSIFAGTIVAQLAIVFVTAATSVPEFYRDRLAVSQEVHAVHGAAFEEALTKFQADASDDATWSLTLSDEEINGWLAVDMPKRFPGVLPIHMREPRVAIQHSQLHIACQYLNGGTSAVLALSADAVPTDKPNQLKFRVLSAKIGSVPGMEHQAWRAIAMAAARSRISIRWLSREEEPEFIVHIPRRWRGGDRDVLIEKIRFEDGQLFVAGNSKPSPKRRQVAGKRARVSFD